MERWRGIVAVVSSAILFGLMPLLANLAYHAGSNPMTLTMHRFLFSVPALFLVARLKKIDLRIKPSELSSILLLSIGSGMTPFLMFSSYQFIPSGISMALHFIYPILVIVGCAVFFGEKMQRIQIISGVVCFLGISLFRTGSSHLSIFGLVLAILSGFTYAFYIIMLRKITDLNINYIKLSFYMALIAGLFFFIVGVPSGNVTFSIPPLAYILGALLAIMTSVVATLLFQTGSRLIGAPNAALFSTAEPLVSVVVGVLFLHETLNRQITIGIILILVSILALTIFEKKEAQSQTLWDDGLRM